MASQTSSNGSSGGRHVQADMATVIDSIRSVFQSLRSSGRGAEHTPGISGAQMYVLEELAGGPALSINELAARTFTHQSSASMIVSRLVERRLVTRVVDRGDARKLCISLTPSGRALLKRKPHAGQSKLEEGLKNLSRSELKQLANTLGVLKEVLSDQSRRSGRAVKVMTDRPKSVRRS